MIIAFCLYKYFPFGGLQRDSIRIAKTVAARGHSVRVYTQSWQGECPAEFELIVVPVHARTNHGRNAEYYAWVQAHLHKHPVERIVGFNKMPGLDVYYAADVCYAEKVAREKGYLYRLTPRYKHFSAFERCVFEPGAKTQLLMLTENQITDFQRHYKTESGRFHLLPPGIYPDRKYDHQIPNARAIYRQKNGIDDKQLLVLQVGSDFKRKGVDRSIEAVSALPEKIRSRTQLMVVGQDKPDRYIALARKHGIAGQVSFFAGRNDIAELMASADLLIHPARQEAAGIVLLEAIVAGLPVIVTEICGYAPYIVAAQCGRVIASPFQQSKLNEILGQALMQDTRRGEWAAAARHYADTEDLYSLPEKAADLIIGEPNA